MASVENVPPLTEMQVKPVFDDGDKVQVRCYSGRIYAQRPESFTMGGREYSVKEVTRTWREPGRLFFRVVTEEGLAFTLEYDEAGDTWRLAKRG